MRTYKTNEKKLYVQFIFNVFKILYNMENNKI